MQFMLLSRSLFVDRQGTIDISVFAGILTWGGVLFGLLIVPGLLWKRTRLAAFVIAAGFHLTNSLIFDIHIFPWLMICATTVFFDADWPDHVFRRFGVLWYGPAETVSAGATAESGSDSRQFGRTGIRSRVLVTASVVYICFHLFWPFRHWLYTGPAGWTEQGHYFAWRMMLRGKTSAVQYLVTDRQTGETVSPDLRMLLNPEQIVKSCHDPEMIHQLAHHLAERYSASGKPRPVVRAVALSSFNGRRPQLMIDPNVDLAAEPRSLRSKSWIVPLLEPLPDMPLTAPIHEGKEKIHLPEIDLSLRTAHTASTNLSPEQVTPGPAL